MLRCTIFIGLLVTVFYTVRSDIVTDRYEEEISYSENLACKPSTLDQGIHCNDIGASVELVGKIDQKFGAYFVPLASAYYVARFADAMGYQAHCPSNTTFLKEFSLETQWSGSRGRLAIDLGCGYDSLIKRQCKAPTGDFPYLCNGAEGTPGTYGRRLETLLYIPILLDANLRWALCVHCWNAKSPENENSEAIATSFNVFNMDPELSPDDRELIINELDERGFNTDPENIIEFDFKTTRCNFANK